MDVELLNLGKKQKLDAQILPASKEDLKKITKKIFDFPWKKEKSGIEGVYKLTLKKDPETILGLIHVVQHEGNGYDCLEIKWIEVTIKHVGKTKTIDNIAGCLIAYACRLSIKMGFSGFVFLEPKTKLVSHYNKKYGFQSISGSRMLSDDKNSKKIIKKYLKDPNTGDFLNYLLLFGML